MGKRRRKRRGKRPPTVRPPKSQVMRAAVDIETGEAGKLAMALGLVVELKWFHGANRRAIRPSLHVLVIDGENDRRIAEWWPGSGRAVLWWSPDRSCNFDSAIDLVTEAGKFRGP